MEVLWAGAQALTPQLIAWRRHLHKHPEPSFAEYLTQQFILAELRQLPELTVRTAAGTGVIADLSTDPHGPWIALRADIDALPIQEVERPYASQRPGWMHACGHDAHTAMLLGAAFLLWENRDLWRGGIRLIFQPGEEKAPGGASLLIQEGILTEKPIQAIWAQHVTPQLPVGKVGLRPGPFMAASDEVQVVLRGPGGHAAYPHLTPDPVTAAAYLITQLQALTSRWADPRTPTVLTFGQIIGGTAPNIIPEQVTLLGTLRTFEESWRNTAKALITRTTEGVAATWRLEATVQFQPGYPVLINDPELTTLTQTWLSHLLGPAQIETLPLWMSSEDFAFYSHRIPACFLRLGTAGDSPETQEPVHTSRFDIDERALPIGTAVLATIAVEALRYFQRYT